MNSFVFSDLLTIPDLPVGRDKWSLAEDRRFILAVVPLTPSPAESFDSFTVRGALLTGQIYEPLKNKYTDRYIYLRTIGGHEREHV